MKNPKVWQPLLVLVARFLCLASLGCCGVSQGQSATFVGEKVLSSARPELAEHFRTNADDRVKQRRHRKLAGAPEPPRLIPDGGTFVHPLLVSLISDQGLDMRYTLDGSDPSVSTTGGTILSGEYVLVDSTSVLRATVLQEDGTALEEESTASFLVESEGKCGKLYLVPFFNSLGLSSLLARVDLDVKTYRSIRIHGLFTDFANFDADASVRPYNGQVVTYSLGGGTGGDLQGFYGGFSGSIGSDAFAFLPPSRAHSVVVRLRMEASGSSFCLPTEDCLLSALDLSSASLRDPNAGYIGGLVTSGGWGILIPMQGTRIARFDASSLDEASLHELDLSEVDNEIAGFSAVAEYFGDGGAGHLILFPGRGAVGPVGGVNSEDSSQTVPLLSSKVVMCDTDAFLTSSCNVLNLRDIDMDLMGFRGGFTSGHWAYLVPSSNSKLVRINLDEWEYGGSSAATVEILDLSRVQGHAGDLTGFSGGWAHGRYAVLVPNKNGKAVFVDMILWSEVEGVYVVDLPSTRRQQVPSTPSKDLHGFIGGTSVGPHVYLSPNFAGTFSGKVVRIDTRDLLKLVNGGEGTDYDGLQIVDVSELDPALAG
jgi:hypothetical protein